MALTDEEKATSLEGVKGMRASIECLLGRMCPYIRPSIILRQTVISIGILPESGNGPIRIHVDPGGGRRSGQPLGGGSQTRHTARHRQPQGFGSRRAPE